LKAGVKLFTICDKNQHFWHRFSCFINQKLACAINHCQNKV